MVLYPPKLYPGPMIQSRSAARRAASDLVITKATITVVSFQVHGVMTRAEKMRKEKSGPARSLPKRSKEDRRPSDRAAKCECRKKPNGQSCKVVDHLEAEGEEGGNTKGDAISHSDWTRESEERWTKFPGQSCPGIGHVCMLKRTKNV